MSNASPGRNRWTLLAIIAVFLLPLAAAYLLYWYMPPGEPGNHGTLIEPPRPLGEFEMTGLEGATAGLGTLKGKWTLLFVGGDQCLEQCRNNLYKIERVRLTQGKNMDRVQSVYLAPQTMEGRAVADTLVEYAGVSGYRISTADLDSMAPGFDWSGARETHERIYLVDPLGNLMMFYSGNADPNGMKEDLERLLKVSQVG